MKKHGISGVQHGEKAKIISNVVMAAAENQRNSSKHIWRNNSVTNWRMAWRNNNSVTKHIMNDAVGKQYSGEHESSKQRISAK